MHVYTYICIFVFKCICVFVCVCMYACIYVYIYVCVYVFYASVYCCFVVVYIFYISPNGSFSRDLIDPLGVRSLLLPSLSLFISHLPNLLFIVICLLLLCFSRLSKNAW